MPTVLTPWTRTTTRSTGEELSVFVINLSLIPQSLGVITITLIVTDSGL